MLLDLDVPAVVSLPCPSLPHTFPSATATQPLNRYDIPLGFVEQYLSLCRFCGPSASLSLPVLSHLPIPLHIVSSLHFRGPLFTTLRVILTCNIVSLIRDTRTASATSQHSVIHPLLLSIILVHSVIAIEWSHGQEVSRLVLQAALRGNVSAQIIATVPRGMHASGFNHPRAGRQQIWVINLFTKHMGVIPPPIDHLVAGFVEHLPHISVGSCPRLLK